MRCIGQIPSMRGLGLTAVMALGLAFGVTASSDEARAQCLVTADGTIQGTVGDLLGAVVGADLAVDCTDSIDGDDIQDDSIDSDHIIDGSITEDDLGTDSVGSDEIQTDAVGADELADDSVDTAAIQDDAVTQDKIADDAVGEDQLADDAVDTAAIQDDAVTSDKIAAGAIETEDLDDGSVTKSKLSSGVRNQMDENTEGVAVALALQNPDLVGAETFGFAMNWGGFEGSSALGIAATGVLGQDVFSYGDRIAISGGVGFGMSEETVGGRVGAQITW